MNNVKKTLLLLSTTVALTGCLSDGNTEKSYEPDPSTPEVDSLFALADGFPIGVALPAGDASNSIFNRNDLQLVVEQHFNQITAENIMKPAYLQPTEGTFYFDDADKLIDYAQTKNISIHGHTLVWHQQSPDWMKRCTDTTNCTDILETHIATVMAHYADSIATWDVVNEAFFDDGSYRNAGDNGSFWYQKLGKTYIPTAFSAARAADADAELYYNDYNLENNGDKLTAVINMISELQSDATPIDGLGFQMHVKSDSPSIENITAALKKAVNTGLKVKITELDIQLNQSGTHTSLTQTLAESQQQRYKEIVAAYLATVPEAQRGGISVWGVSDADSWIVSLYGNPDWPLLFDDSLNQKMAMQGFAEALKADPETPAPIESFTDDFADGVSWYKKEASNVAGTFVHNSAEQTMDIDIDWSSETDSFDIAVIFDQPIDMTAGASLTLKLKIPAANVTQGNVIIQPFIEDINYVPGYITWLREDFIADNWVTITIDNLGPDYGYGYVGDGFDFTQVNSLGLQIQAQGGGVPEKGTIQVDDVMLIK